MSAQALITEHLDLWTGAVTKKSSSGRGSNGKVELNGIKKLRELILELAVRGKLVEQDPNDEPAAILVSKMLQLRLRLTNTEGLRTKASDSLSFSDEYLCIPSSWAWVRLGNMAKFIDYRGKTPAKISTGKRLITAKNIRQGHIDLQPEEFISEADYTSWMTRGFPRKGDLLFTPEAPLGNAAIVDLDEEFALAQRAICFQWHIPEISEFMLIQILASPFQGQLVENATGMTATGIKASKLKEIPVAIPPLEEQQRIVQKVDELMALCDRLEQHTSDQLDAHETLVDSLLGTLTQSANATELANNWARLAEHFDTLFTTDQGIDKLKQTILQLAVMGRLVEQNAGDEPAKNLIKCIDEEIGQRVSEGTIRKPKALALVEGSFPYELPKGWRWEKLGRFTLIGTGATPSRGRPDYYSPPEYPWVTSGETSQTFICDTNERVSSLAVKETNISIYPTGTLIVAMYGQGKTRGQITELKVAAGTNQACAAIQPIIEDASHRQYIKLCFVKLYDEIRENAAGGAQPNLNTGKIADILIPLPPLAEQHRIVQKVDELIALCDQLKKRLSQSSETCCQLAEAVVEQELREGDRDAGFDKKYEKLVLNDDCLTDPLLMALAWKKAHDYIRTANWYADNFELDVSSIDLPNRCSEWVEDIKDELAFRPLELVPAPKTHSWEFVDPINSIGGADFKLVWQPKKPGEKAKRAGNKQEDEDEDNEFLKLRPLAHIGIREQTIMTLVMMCLADEVETKQGDPSIEYKKTHEKGVVSYGNRLYCRYEADKAEHSYGATTTYSKFFTDYRKFLERPYHFARKVLQEKSEDEEVYLLELDLSQFFDRIDRQILIDKIKELAREQGPTKEIDEATIGNVLSAFKDWNWSSLAKATFGEVCFSEGVPTAPLGLPQGLVASGFLANIYMANFDEHMKGLIGNFISDEGDIRLVDYCRYVDDMRLVLIGPNREKLEEKISVDGCKANNHLDIIKLAVIENIESELNYLNLEANKKKTKVEIFRGKSIGISQTLEDIQTNVSGPVSHEDVEIHLGQLESLLALSSGASEDQSNSSGRFNRLAAIEKDIFDIREDTLKRFAANKISRLLNNIRHFTSREIDDNGHSIPGEWDYLQERLARRLVACWSRDPALALLLKKGLELFPGTKLLEPVLEQIGYLQNLPQTFSLGISEPQAIKQAAIGNYCLAEIFRHAATVIHRKDRQAIPAHADVDGFFERLQTSAVAITSATKTLSDSDDSEEEASASPEQSNSKSFDFLAAQARFLLLVRLDTTLETSSGCPFHDYIFKLAKGFRNITLPNDLVTRDISAGILIASQLIGDTKPLLRASASLLEKLENAKKVLELIAIQDAELFRSLILHARPLRYKWLDEMGVPELVEKLYIGIRPSAKPLVEIKSATPLYKLISRPDNPFDNEIMALKLMQALLDEKKNADFEKAERSDVIDLAKTKVIFEKFSAPPTYEVFNTHLLIEIKFHSTLTEATKHLYSEHDDTFVLQRIALCLRSVLAGSGDPTGFGQTISPKTGYRGLKSTQYKRQIGLLTTPESLAGEAAQFSGWLTTLLSKLLKWPGIRINDHGYPWPTELTIENVRTLVEKRLAKLKECYCQQSGMLGLPELISPNWDLSKRSLVVAMVQTKMPLQKNFVEHGLYLDAPEFRVKHRKHLARVAKLVTKHIEAQHIEKPTNGEREQNIDLIILPELAVHEDDIDILIHLSRKTHAIVVAGLGFINQSNVKGPNNCAVWVVPRKHNGNKNEIRRLQGKHHMTASETKMKVQPWRPYQLMLELAHPAFPTAPGFTLTAAICFDSTDIALSADLRDKSHALMIPALNRDVNTFDSMVEALHYHMYQHVVLVNTGEYGGSYAMAPYNERYDRLIAHSSGNDQVTINTFKMNMFDFRRDGVGVSMQSGIKQKAAPAGI